MTESTAETTAVSSTLSLDLTNFDALGPQWDEFASASGNLFSTREWLRTWVEHHGGEDPLLIACHADDGRLAAILPVEVRRITGVRVLRFLGHGPSDQLGPLCDPADDGLAVTAMQALLQRPPRPYEIFLGRHLPDSQDWAARLRARRVRTEASPVLPLDAQSWDAMIDSFTSGLRKEIRYDTRRLAREHEVGYRLCEDPASLANDLDVLFDLHEAQWGSSPFKQNERFHRAFAAVALERGWLRLWTLEVDGRPLAVKLNFRFSGAEFSYQAGRDLSWRGPSLGLVNLSHAMHAAFEEGAREYRFLRGAERYKFRFPVQDSAVETVVKSRGGIGRLALGAALGLDRMRTARRLVGRRLSG